MRIVVIEIFRAGRWYKQELARQLPLLHTQGTESDPKVVMEDVGIDTADSGSNSGGPIKEANSATDNGDLQKLL